MMIFCNQCGTGLPNDARFCSSCGASIHLPAPFPLRPLVRPIHGRRIAGVCRGLSESYGWDIGLVRFIAALGLFFSAGILLIAYLAGWLGIPEEASPAIANDPLNYTNIS